MPKEVAKQIVKEIVEVFESEENNTNVFIEIVQLSMEKEVVKFGYTSGDKKMDELSEWIRLNAKKIHLLEKLRRALVFSGVPAEIIRAELLGVYKKYTAKPEYRL